MDGNAIDRLMSLANKTEEKEEKKETPPRRTLIIDMGVSESGHKNTPGIGLSERDNLLMQHFLTNIMAHRVKKKLNSSMFLGINESEPTITFTGYEEMKMLLSALLCKVTDMSDVLAKDYNFEVVSREDFENEYGSLEGFNRAGK